MENVKVGLIKNPWSFEFQFSELVHAISVFDRVKVHFIDLRLGECFPQLLDQQVLEYYQPRQVVIGVKNTFQKVDKWIAFFDVICHGCIIIYLIIWWHFAREKFQKTRLLVLLEDDHYHGFDHTIFRH